MYVVNVLCVISLSLCIQVDSSIPVTSYSDCGNMTDDNSLQLKIDYSSSVVNNGNSI